MTQMQGFVSGLLEELKLERLPATPHICGESPKFKVTDETVRYLKSLIGKVIECSGNGSIEIA
jgi:hypothetical protein